MEKSKSVLAILLIICVTALSACSSFTSMFDGVDEKAAHEAAFQKLPKLAQNAAGQQKTGYLLKGPENTKTSFVPASFDVLPPYQLQVGDVLSIKLLLNPELEEEVVVRPDGKISTAVAQNIMAFGKTPEELQETLNLEYSEYLSDPNVAVIVRSFAPTRIYVLGEVNEPGEYITSGPNYTLLQAIATAGNIKNSANPDEILIFRRGTGDRPEAYRADYDKATSGLMPHEDIRLAAYDVVYVPRTAIADAYVLYEQTIQQFLRPSINFGLSYRLDDNE